ncbi:MAG: hypothetical protein PHI44_02190 [Candidatus Ratteibacteria bacterium]|nr:hypothetical protein [Candidatus Ratteibacteria bacterium]
MRWVRVISAGGRPEQVWDARAPNPRRAVVISRRYRGGDLKGAK